MFMYQGLANNGTGQKKVPTCKDIHDTLLDKLYFIMCRRRYINVQTNGGRQRAMTTRHHSSRCGKGRATPRISRAFFGVQLVHIGVYLSAADWKTSLRACVHVPIYSSSMKNGAKAASRGNTNLHVHTSEKNQMSLV